MLPNESPKFALKLITDVLPALASIVLICATLNVKPADAAPLGKIPQNNEVIGHSTVHAGQNSELRIANLEQQVRELTGKLEELNFMVLQMQEQIRVLQGGSGLTADSGTGSTEPTHGDAGVQSKGNATNGSVKTAPRKIGTEAAAQKPRFESAAQVTNGANAGSIALGTPPKDLGTMELDNKGHVVQETVDYGGSAAATGSSTPNYDRSTATDLSQFDNAKDLYDYGYKHLLSGDYKGAERIFRNFQERFPSDSLIADAHYWLGEALYGQERYREAAQVYSDMQRDYKDSPRGPEDLLKLGMSMAKLGNPKVACAVFSEIGRRYKTPEPALIKRVKEQQSLNQCR